MCICNLIIYQIRPCAYDFLRAIHPFFEIIAFSRLPPLLLEIIIDHFETILNETAEDARL